MRSLLGVPHSTLLLIIGSLALLIVVILGGAALRNPLVPRLALRNLPRRPLWALLITMSLTLSTVILSSALTTGDTMSLAVRSVVAGALGSADEVVFVPQQRPRGGFDIAQALAGGTFLTGITSYFPAGEAARVASVLEGDTRVAGVLPTIFEQTAVVAPNRGFRAQLGLIGLPDRLPDGFEALRRADGVPLTIDSLAPDEVDANREAAAALGIGPGDQLRLIGLPNEPAVRVRGVGDGSGLGGAQPTLFLPLERLQQLTGRTGQVNRVLIANRGTPAQRLDHSWPIVVQLRAALMDEATAESLFRTFTAPGRREAIATATSGRGANQFSPKLRRLVDSLAAPGPTDEFKALVQDPELLSGLASLRESGRLGGDAGPNPRALDRGLRTTLPGAPTLRVLDIQQIAQTQADLWGSAFSSVFVALGLCSLATGLMLIVLVFSLVALERRSELGILRALGGRRGEAVLVLATEGALHSLAGSLIGLLAGTGLAFALVGLASRMVAEYGFRLEPTVEPVSLLISFGLGFGLTVVTVATTAWRASRFSIVAAIREADDPVGGPPGPWALLLASLPLIGGGLLLGLGVERSWPAAYTAGVVATIIGLALTGRWLLSRLGARRAERAVTSLAGLALIGWWFVPPAWLARLGLPVGPVGIELSVLSGLAMLLGAVWVIADNVGRLGQFGRGRPLWRLSTAYIGAHRFRTGMTLGMFGLVILSLTLAAVLLTATTAAYGDPVAATGGWDIRADSGEPPVDLRPALTAGGLRPEQISGLGATSGFAIEALQTDGGSARWRAGRLLAVDAGFTAAVGAELTAATGPTRATWEELTRRPGTAIVGAGLLGETASSLRLTTSESGPFRPFVLWVRDTRAPRPAVRLEVVGLADARSPYGGSIVTSAATLADWPAAESSAYLLQLARGTSLREVAAGVAVAVPELRVQLLGQELRLVQGIRELLALILQGFMGIGLLSGVAALGVISTRAVVERRRQIGVLRAVGLSARAIGLGLLLEAGLVALLGAGLGVAIGLNVARRVVGVLVRQNPELHFVAPWSPILLLVLAALGASLLMTLLPAWQASRLAPAEALRDA